MCNPFPIDVRRLIGTFTLVIFNYYTGYSQGVGISNATIVPDPSSILELRSSTQGLLLPRLTTAQRDAISAPADGLMIFNTSTLTFNYYQTGWQSMGGGSGIIFPVSGGTGIANNNAATLSFSGAYPTTFTTTAATSVTLPNAGTLYGSATGSITSAQLFNSMADKTGTGTMVYAASPTFAGIPTAPTATVGTNSTQLATTAFVLGNTGGYSSVDAGATITTSSAIDVTIPGMTLTPGAGTYLALFNSAYTVAPGNITVQGAADLTTAYNTLIGVTNTNTTHAVAFGSGETLNAGVYSVGAAGSVAGTLTLDALGDANAVFIFKFAGAFTTGAGASVVLTNGASPCNVFWVVQGAIAMGAATAMKGTLIANNAALSAGAGSIISGRLFTTSGAITVDGLTITIPTGCTYLNLGTLSTFGLFTSLGNIGNTGSSVITGDVGTNGGSFTGFGTATVNGTFYTPGASVSSGTYSIYQNGVLIPNSGRTRTSNTNTVDLSLQAIAIVTAGQVIEVKWRTDSGTLTLGSRILSLIKVK